MTGLSHGAANDARQGLRSPSHRRTDEPHHDTSLVRCNALHRCYFEYGSVVSASFRTISRFRQTLSVYIMNSHPSHRPNLCLFSFQRFYPPLHLLSPHPAFQLQAQLGHHQEWLRRQRLKSYSSFHYFCSPFYHGAYDGNALSVIFPSEDVASEMADADKHRFEKDKRCLTQDMRR